MQSGEEPHGSPGVDSAEELGRKAARFVKAARPRVERVLRAAKPRLEQTSRRVVEYAQEHEDELKQTAAKLIQARVGGPLRLVLDAVGRESGRDSRLECPSCRALNPPGSRFCNQCGAPVA